MKLYELRQILTDYEKSWSIKKVFGEVVEASNVRLFLKRFDEVNPRYEFNASELYEILNLIPPDSSSVIASSIKKHLDTGHLFTIFYTLKRVGLITPRTFKVIFGLSNYQQDSLCSILCTEGSTDIRVTKEVIDTVLVIVQRNIIFSDAIKKCLILLSRKNQLNNAALNLLKSNVVDFYLMPEILKELEIANYLNGRAMDYLAKQYLLRESLALFTVLNRAKITINDELFDLIVNNNHLGRISEILEILLDSDCHVNHDMIVFIFKEGFGVFAIEKISVLKVLQAYGMLADKAFSFVIDCYEIYSLGQILEILSVNALLIANKELIDRIINKEIKIDRLYGAINYLRFANLFDSSTLELCANARLNLNLPYDFINIVDLFALFHRGELIINKPLLETLFTWSDLNIKRLYSMVSDLIRAKLLTTASFEEALTRIATRLPPVFESTVQKTSRKESNLPRSEVVLDNKFRYFKDQGNQGEGRGLGSVKKGFNENKHDEPMYAIKKLRSTDPVFARNRAAREVKYNRLLERRAFYFAAKSVTVVSEWQREKGMHQFTSEELLQAPILQRLHCLSSGLSDLDFLHHRYRFHGNVTRENYILDLKNASMKLIDFGATHKKGSNKFYDTSFEYNDRELSNYHFCKDIYAMSTVIMCLFPEIYTVSFNYAGKASVEMSEGVLTPQMQAIVKLVDAMRHSKTQSRCTSEDAVSFVNELINKFDKLSEGDLQVISNQTIERKETTVEDALRNTVRATA